jgi:tetratricopeptide (TPR) repeat protein
MEPNGSSRYKLTFFVMLLLLCASSDALTGEAANPLEVISTQLDGSKSYCNRSPTFLQLSNAWLDAGDKQQARKYVARALKMLRTEGSKQDVYYKPAYYLQAAEIYIKLGDMKTAKGILKTERYWDCKPKEKKDCRLSIYKGLAPKFAEAGEFELAEELLKKAYREGPCPDSAHETLPAFCTADVHAALGLAYARKGDLKKAAEHARVVDSVLDAGREMGRPALLQQMQTHRLLGDQEKAFKRLVAARDTAQPYEHGLAGKMEGLVEIAQAFEEIGHKKEAFEITDTLLAKAREYQGNQLVYMALPMLYVARWHQKMGRSSEAEKILERAADVAIASLYHNPHGPDAAILAAELLAKTDGKAQAAQVLRTALRDSRRWHRGGNWRFDLIDIAEVYVKTGVPFDGEAKELLSSLVRKKCAGGANVAKGKDCDYRTTHRIVHPARAADSRPKTYVAPLFRHGRGAGPVCDCAWGDATFLSEDVGREVIIKGMSKAGISFDKTDFDLTGEKLIDPEPGLPAAFMIDGYSTAKNLGFEFVSLEDTASFGGITCGSHDQNYDLRAVAENTRVMLAARGKINSLVFYDPVVLRGRRGVPARDGNAMPEERNRKKVRLLTAQVRDALEWIKARETSEAKGVAAQPQIPETDQDVLGMLRRAIEADRESQEEDIFAAQTHIPQYIRHLLVMNKREKAVEVFRKFFDDLLHANKTAVMGIEAVIAAILGDDLMSAGLKKEAGELLQWALTATEAISTDADNTGKWRVFVPCRQAEHFAALSHSFARLGDFETAMKSAEKAYAIVEKLQSAGDKPTKEDAEHIHSAITFSAAMDAMAAVEMASAGKTAQARVCLDRARKVLEGEKDGGILMRQMIPVATGYHMIGEREISKRLFDRIWEDILKGTTAPSLWSAVSLAEALEKVGDSKRAEEAAKKAFQMSPTLDGKPREKAEVMLAAARWHEKHGKNEEAAGLARSVIAMAKTDQKPEHGVLLGAVEVLSKTGDKKGVEDGLRTAVYNIRDSRYLSDDEIAGICSAYEETGTVPDEQVKKALNEILQRMETAGGIVGDSNSTGRQ